MKNIAQKQGGARPKVVIALMLVSLLVLSLALMPGLRAKHKEANLPQVAKTAQAVQQPEVYPEVGVKLPATEVVSKKDAVVVGTDSNKVRTITFRIEPRLGEIGNQATN